MLWRHQDFYFATLMGANPIGPPRLTVSEVVAAAREGASVGFVIAAPLMHVGGTMTVFIALLNGWRAVLSPKFDPAQALRLVSAEAEGAMGLSVIGDAMARPIAD